MSLLLALVAGLVIGLALGALGGGGSILAVPVLVYLLGQTAAEATTGSLVVVGVTSLAGAVTAHRAGNAMVSSGVTFGLVAVGGAAFGARASTLVSGQVLLGCFAALMLVVGVTMGARQVRERRPVRVGAGGEEPEPEDRPLLSLRDGFACDCPRALKLLVTATAVGLLTGFLGVGGGFLVVPALVLALGLPMDLAAGTSLVVIALTSAAALVVRAGLGVHPDWGLVAALTAASAAGGVAGARLADRTDTRRLGLAFTVLVLAVGAYTAVRALPALF